MLTNTNTHTLELAILDSQFHNLTELEARSIVGGGGNPTISDPEMYFLEKIVEHIQFPVQPPKKTPIDWGKIARSAVGGIGLLEMRLVAGRASDHEANQDDASVDRILPVESAAAIRFEPAIDRRRKQAVAQADPHRRILGLDRDRRRVVGYRLAHSGRLGVMQRRGQRVYDPEVPGVE